VPFPSPRHLRRVILALADGQWHNLRTVARRCGLSTAGCSARIRDLRKHPFRLAIAVRQGRHAGPYDYRVNDPEAAKRVYADLCPVQVPK
jgi:uncharacterized heparinase superfamily protein